MRPTLPGRREPALLLGLLAVLLAVLVIRMASTSPTDDRDGPPVGAGTGRAEVSGETDAETDSAVGDPGADSDGPGREPVVYEAVVINTHPHDPTAYTQGLEFVDELLLESTGLVGQSSLRLVEPETGEIVRSVTVDESLFAEGVTVVDDEIWQLTWKDQTLLIHSLDGFEELRRLPYVGEGWGLCATDDHLIMSDGSDVLTLRDRTTFEILDTVAVTDGGESVERLNELECVGDRVWANIWQRDRIVSIDPATGEVDGTVSVASLVPPGVVDADSDNVANGIAHEGTTGRFWLTGKRWPVMYEVELVPAID